MPCLIVLWCDFTGELQRTLVHAAASVGRTGVFGNPRPSGSVWRVMRTVGLCGRLYCVCLCNHAFQDRQTFQSAAGRNLRVWPNRGLWLEVFNRAGEQLLLCFVAKSLFLLLVVVAFFVCVTVRGWLVFFQNNTYRVVSWWWWWGCFCVCVCVGLFFF